MSARIQLIRTLAAATAVIVLAPMSASAAGLGGFSVRPAEFNPRDPATRAYFKPTIRAGEAFSGKLVLSNPAATPIKLLISPVDGLTAVTSGAVYGNRQDRLRAAGRWVKPSVATIPIGPRSHRSVAFKLAVPRSAVAGEHLAGIAVEAADRKHTHGQFEITEVFRVVIGIEIRVPGAATRAIALTDATLSPLPGTKLASVIISLANRGQLTCKPRLSVTLQKAGRGRTVTRRLDTILPGDQIPYPLPWPASLARGEYRVSAHATGCGHTASLTSYARAGIALNGRAEPAASQPPQPRTITTPWWFLALAVAGGLLIGLISALLIHTRRRKHYAHQPPSPDATPAHP